MTVGTNEVHKIFRKIHASLLKLQPFRQSAWDVRNYPRHIREEGAAHYLIQSIKFEVYHHFSGLSFIAEVNFWGPLKTVFLAIIHNNNQRVR